VTSEIERIIAGSKTYALNATDVAAALSGSNKRRPSPTVADDCGIIPGRSIHPNRRGSAMAKKVIFVSDLSGKELDANSAVRVTVSFSDARRGTYVVDAAENDAEVQKLISVGTKQARRGRPRKPQG
jgi:hypothetical protein